MTTGAAKPTRPATSLLAVVIVLDDLRGQRASSACHRHRRHPVETGRPRWWIHLLTSYVRHVTSVWFRRQLANCGWSLSLTRLSMSPMTGERDVYLNLDDA